MSDVIIVAVITGLFSTTASIVGAWLIFKTNQKRIPYENLGDGMEAAQVAFEISERSQKRQLELEKKVTELDHILSKRHYKVTVYFALGENPTVEKASIEAVDHIQHPLKM